MVATGDGDLLARALMEDLPEMNNALLDKLIAYTPETTEVQDLHDVYFMAVDLRGDAYEQILQVLLDLDAQDEEIDAAFDLLEVSDAIFLNFEEMVAIMTKELGFDN